jgi:hypothetical protein
MLYHTTNSDFVLLASSNTLALLYPASVQPTRAVPGESEKRELEQITEAIAGGHSIIVLGKTGLAEGLPKAVLDHFFGEMAVAIAVYKGSGKKFFEAIARQLEIPTESEDGKPVLPIPSPCAGGGRLGTCVLYS